MINHNYEELPLPGIHLEKPLAHQICETFLGKYHQGPKEVQFEVSGIVRTIPQLSWLTWKQASYSVLEEVHSDIFENPVFHENPALFLMLWNWKDDIYRATPVEIQKFIEDMAPWQATRDYYVFPESLDWCIVFTHEEQIFVTGNFFAESKT